MSLKSQQIAEILADHHHNLALKSTNLEGPMPMNWQTPLSALNAFMARCGLRGTLSEWGVPHGSLSRLLPVLVANALSSSWVWIGDKDKQIYPPAWEALGCQLSKCHFLYGDEPLQSLRVLLREACFSTLVLDCQVFIDRADYHAFARYCERNQLTLLVLRSYFLSEKKGNPHARYRFNSSFSLQRRQFQLSLIKGRGERRQLRLPWQEVIHD